MRPSGGNASEGQFRINSLRIGTNYRFVYACAHLMAGAVSMMPRRIFAVTTMAAHDLCHHGNQRLAVTKAQIKKGSKAISTSTRNFSN